MIATSPVRERFLLSLLVEGVTGLIDDADAAEATVREKTPTAGEAVATPDTGGVQAAGGSAHDAALRQIEAELTVLGFTVSILAQDGSEKPDARASHSDVADRFAIEIETTTPGDSAKVLTNLRKAQESCAVALSETAWRRRERHLAGPQSG